MNEKIETYKPDTWKQDSSKNREEDKKGENKQCKRRDAMKQERRWTKGRNGRDGKLYKLDPAEQYILD